jgi:hypothetical protein
MELLIFYPDGHSKTRHFDGPPLLALQQAVGGDVDVVPGFSSISQAGVVHRCAAYCDKVGKRRGRPINTWATALWHLALRRHGYERGLRRPNGKVADWLVGNVAVVMEAAMASLTPSPQQESSRCGNGLQPGSTVEHVATFQRQEHLRP